MTPPTIIDIEASGFGTGSYPIEIGFITEDLETWCSLVTPEENWEHWDQGAESVHHIARNLLFTRGKTVRTIAQELNERLQGQTVYTDGWGHDYIWMSRLFDAADITPHFKLEDLRQVLTLEQQAAWHETKENVIKELNAKRHRASIDAKVLQMTWIKTKEIT